MSTTQGGGRRQAVSYFRYASMVTDALAAETLPATDSPPAAPAVAVVEDGDTTSVGEAADAAGLTTALWRAAHALSPAAAVVERPAGVAGPYSATAAGEAAPPTGGAGHLDRRG